MRSDGADAGPDRRRRQHRRDRAGAARQPEPAAGRADGPAALVGDLDARRRSAARAAAEGVASTPHPHRRPPRRCGSGGCNSFRGSYSLDGGTFRFGPIAATRRACPPPQMQQETRFFAALEATRGVRVEDGALLLLDAAGATLRA